MDWLNSKYQTYGGGLRQLAANELNPTRNAFIAECKLWGAEKALIGALEQLLNYLTWRDCKASPVLFNKDVAGFSGIQEAIKAAFSSHPSFIREKAGQPVGEWRFVLRSREDSGREVVVHIFYFNLFDASNKMGRKR